MKARSLTAIKFGLPLSAIFILTTTVFLFRANTPMASASAGMSQRSGAVVYAQSCARCHGSDGRANTAKGRSVGATDLTSAAWSPDAARDTRIVTRGKESMPAFKGKLKPAEIDAVVNYIRRFKQ